MPENQGVPPVPHIPPPRHTVHPGADFYTFVNGNWLRHVNMPPYLSSYGVSEEIEELVEKDLEIILKAAREEVRTTADKEIPHTKYLLGTLAESALNIQVQDLNVKFVRNMVSGLRCIRDTHDVGSTLGDFMKHRIKSLIQVIVVPTETDSTKLRFALASGDLGLPDPSYYRKTNGVPSRTIQAYSKLLEKCGVAFEVEGLDRVVSLETAAAPVIMRARQDQEILMSGSELRQKYKNIPWDAIFETALGWSTSKISSQKFLILTPTWFTAINKWMKVLPLEFWRAWLSAYLILHTLPLLPPPYDTWDFELYGHRLRGQTEKSPQKRQLLRLAEVWLTGSLGDAYIHQFVKPSVKEKALEIARDIRSVAAERAGATEWLDPVTRAVAKKKVQNIYLGVAYPSYIEKDKKTTLDPERLVKNVFTLAELDFKDDIEKIDTELRPEAWDDPVFAVNAYYYAEGNRLILPAGILRWPFFDVHASDGWNFGALGATIGHEITHAFDSDGKDFDEKGNRRIWWSNADMKRYSEKVNALIALYSKTEYFGHKLNGHLTLSENISDLGGLAISLAALKKRLAARKASPQETKKQICEFFMSYAVSWRTKEKKEKAIQSLFMDVHAPPIARVNNIVCQFDDWYECFDIRPGNKLYKAPENRIRIF
jgi:putative endopeptidase